MASMQIPIASATASTARSRSPSLASTSLRGNSSQTSRCVVVSYCSWRAISDSLGPSSKSKTLAVGSRSSRLPFSGCTVPISWKASVQTPPLHGRTSPAGKGGGDSAIRALVVDDPAPVSRAAEGDDKGETKYDWRTEWYPLYLTAEIPREAPLALNVYDHNLVLFYDGDGQLNCLEDHCPHRAAKLSDGQIMDGNLECLYHGWQFKGDGSCAKIPQLPSGAVIPRSACARSYAIKESQDVVWVWMGDKQTADESKIPWFENYAREGFQHVSTIHEFPYDHSILVENVLDPAHVHIAHDRTDFSARREKAEALKFEVTERTSRGFAGKVQPLSAPMPFFYRFQSPSIVSNDLEFKDKNGVTQYSSACFLVRPTGQGKCAIVIRFGGTGFGNLLKVMPKFLQHMLGAKVFDEDVIFLAAQNETLIRKGVPTDKVYLNLRSSDTMVVEYRKWLDKVGHGLPYYFGHKTASSSPVAALVERAPAGLEAHAVSTQPSKGAFGHMYARDPTNRYFKHVVHCKSCKSTLSNFRKSQTGSLVLALLSAAVAIVISNAKRRAALVALALFFGAMSWAMSQGVKYMTQNFVRPTRRSLSQA